MMRALRFLLLACILALGSAAYAGPRSGSSFGGFRGFRSSGFGRPSSGGFSRGFFGGGRRSYGGGSSFIFLPSFGWGYGGYGGGMGMLGNLVLVGVVCMGAIMVVRSIRRASQRGALTYRAGYYDDDDGYQSVDRSYVYKVQLGIGRSGRRHRHRP